MADTDIVQVIAEARIDARSLSEFVFKPADFMVTRRLAPSINTLEYYLNHFRNVEAEGNSAIASANTAINNIIIEGSSVVARADDIISATQASANTAINNIIIDGNAQISNAISNAGFVQVGTFAAGATLANRNDAIQASDGKLYRWGGSLPKTVAASSTPENSGGFGADAWLEVSDASLAQKLAGLGGASTIGSGVSVFNNMAEFLAAESQIKYGSNVFLQSLYQDLDLEGEGRVYTYSKSNPKAIKQPTASGFLSRDFDGKVFIAEFGATGDVVEGSASRDVDSAALQSCFDVIREYGGGTLSMGRGCVYHLRGIINVECSNLYWEINGSTLVLGFIWLKWHPDSFGYGSYKNVHIKNGVWLGNTYNDLSTTTGVRAGGSIQCDMGKIDGVWVTGNTYIESTFGGHTCDLLGSRFVHFENNTILGSANSNRPYAEIVQLSAATTGSAGITIDADKMQFFDELPPTHVYVRNNTYKPYTNPVTNIISYPTRPIGEHGYSSGVFEVYFEDNYVEDVIYQTGSALTASCMVLIGHDLHFNRNTIILNNGNAFALMINGYNKVAEDSGQKPVFEIKDNKIKVSNVSYEPSTTLITIPFKYIGSNGANDSSVDYIDGELGYDLTIENNDFDVDYSAHTGRSWSAIFVDTNLKEGNIELTNNKFNISGNVESHFTVSTGGGKKRDGSVTKVKGNHFYGSGSNYMLNLPSEAPTPVAGAGMAYHVIDNSFYNASRALLVSSANTAHVSGNRFYNWKVYSEAGDVAKHLVYSVGAFPLITDGNIIIAPNDDGYAGDIPELPRADIVKINRAGYERALEGFNVTKTTAYPLQL